jgi:hypothetical protein
MPLDYQNGPMSLHVADSDHASWLRQVDMNCITEFVSFLWLNTEDCDSEIKKKVEKKETTKRRHKNRKYSSQKNKLILKWALRK